MVLITPSSASGPSPRQPLDQAHLSTEPAALLDIDPYTLVLWRVLPGQRPHFLDTWRRLLLRLQQLERPPLMGTLLQSLVDDHQFYSVASWDLMNDIARMRRDDACRLLIAELQSLCDLSAGGNFARVLSLDHPELPEAFAR